MGERSTSKARYRREGDVLDVRTSRPHFALAGFLTFFLVVWTGACLFIASRYRRDMPLDELIFPIPFFVGWLGLAFGWCYALFFRDRVRLGPEGLDYRSWVFVPWERRRLPLDELLGVGTFRQEDSSGGSQPLVSRGVEIRNYGRPLRVGQSLGDEERGEVTALLREHLKSLHGRTEEATEATHRDADEPPPSDELFAPVTSSIRTPREHRVRREFTGQPLVLDDPPGTFDRPAECCYRLDRTLEGVDFVWRGRSMLLGSFVVLCLMLFWNTITLAFALQLRHGFDLKLLLFLIPFVLVGLAFLLGWLAALFQPFFRERWRFTRQKIEHRFTVFWLGPTWRYEVIPLAHLELHRGDPPEKKKRRQGPFADDEPNTSVAPSGGRRGSKQPKSKAARRTGKTSPYGRDFRLVFMAADGRPLCDVRHLNEGEARWIADVVRGEFPSWFS